jgi:hypothetical protein
MTKDTMLEVTSYEVLGQLPDIFTFDNGEELKDPADWDRRRAEIYKSAVELQYGTMPPEPEFLEIETLYKGKNSNSYKITTGPKAHPVSFRMQVYHPDAEKYPVVVDGDGCFAYSTHTDFVSTMTENGIAFALFDRTELAHDIRGEGRRQGQLYNAYPEYTFGALGAWAWGYSRCVDALLSLELIDPEMIVFSGHSRGGKTAMLAGVLDERAAIVNPNETCAGGCSCYRINIKAICEDGIERESERGGQLTSAFPLWMGSKLANYAGREAELPFDSHYLKALVAPRVLFVSEAASDLWGNPVGTWQTSEAAKEVYKFLGCKENLLWYFRRGTHYHEIEDVEQLVNVIKHVKYGEPLNDKYFKKPFADVEPAYSWRAPENKSKSLV